MRICAEIWSKENQTYLSQCQGKHNLCLLEVYRMFVGLVKCKAKESDCFYLRAAKHKFSFEKSPLRIDMLNAILPKYVQGG